MILQLRPDVHAAAIDDHLVLLDVARDAYLCLPEAASVLEDGGASRRLVSGSLAERLLEAGLAHEASEKPSDDPRPPPPRRTVIHQQARGSTTPRILAAAMGARRDVLNARRLPGLTAYLDIARADQPLCDDPGAVRAAARQFWDILPWLQVRGECLQRSAALVSFLRRLGLRADWVFGVRLWPFAAHCWVQCEDACLNDDFERLEAFTPILRR